MTRKSVSRLALALSFFITVIFTNWTAVKQAQGQIENPPTKHYSWTEPTDGTPVDHYVIQMLVNEVKISDVGEVASPEVTISVKRGPVVEELAFYLGNKYQLRVAGVDLAGVQGPYSPWSDPISLELDPPGF